MEAGEINKIQYRSSKYKSGSEELCSLLLYFDGDQFLSCLIKCDDHQVLKAGGNRKREEQSEEEYLKHELKDLGTIRGYKSVQIALSKVHFTVVPDSIFQEDKLAEYIKISYPEIRGLLRNDCISPSLNVVYDFPESWFEIIESELPESNITSLVSSLITKLQGMSKFESSRLMNVHISETHCMLILVDGGNLKVANSYPYNSIEDALYFATHASEEYGFQRDLDQIYLTGNLGADSVNLTFFRKYFRNVDSLPIREDLKWDEELSLEMSSELSVLTSLPLCES